MDSGSGKVYHILNNSLIEKIEEYCLERFKNDPYVNITRDDIYDYCVSNNLTSLSRNPFKHYFSRSMARSLFGKLEASSKGVFPKGYQEQFIRRVNKREELTEERILENKLKNIFSIIKNGKVNNWEIKCENKQIYISISGNLK